MAERLGRPGRRRREQRRERDRDQRPSASARDSRSASATAVADAEHDHQRLGPAEQAAELAEHDQLGDQIPPPIASGAITRADGPSSIIPTPAPISAAANGASSDT